MGVLCVEFDTSTPTGRPPSPSPPLPVTSRPASPLPVVLRSLVALHPASSPLRVIAQRNGCQGARRASAAPTTHPYLPAPLPRPQSSLAGSTSASTFLGVLRCETDTRVHTVHPPSPPAPIASHRPFPSLPLAP
ncbi:hypothetical protein M422DRAFT_782759 [Sphaerobolus stellatus SS14]|uniref:Uncharacterized protein n=1 Tax=Sphaerobolus stellatus (strain SS14) TaxID=990650 RepID=A0A0C9UIS5_SPHS4|nr:hypothetical protein M422DRAFT_782759 [Sphaerobolus stellatus SS14]